VFPAKNHTINLRSKTSISCLTTPEVPPHENTQLHQPTTTTTSTFHSALLTLFNARFADKTPEKKFILGRLRMAKRTYTRGGFAHTWLAILLTHLFGNVTSSFSMRREESSTMMCVRNSCQGGAICDPHSASEWADHQF